MSPVSEYVVQTGITLLGVIALAWAILYAGRRLGVPHLRGPMELLGRLPLEHRRAVCLVRVGETVLILGSSEAGIVKLGEMPREDLPSPSATPAKPFSDVFAAVLKRKRPPPEQGDRAE